MPEAQTPADGRAMEVVVARGNLYLAREVCDAYLCGLHAVALLQREAEVLIVPLVRDSAGGLLLKQRNGRGDRVIHAQEFFRTHGYLESFEQRSCRMIWRAELAALAILDLPRDPDRAGPPARM